MALDIAKIRARLDSVKNNGKAGGSFGVQKTAHRQSASFQLLTAIPLRIIGSTITWAQISEEAFSVLRKIMGKDVPSVILRIDSGRNLMGIRILIP